MSRQVPMVNGRAAAAGMAGQTHAALNMIEAILAHAGCRLAHVVKTTVWITDAGEYPAFNAAYAERCGPEAVPARTVIAGLIAPAMVEKEAVAVRPAI